MTEVSPSSNLDPVPPTLCPSVAITKPTDSTENPEGEDNASPPKTALVSTLRSDIIADGSEHSARSRRSSPRSRMGTPSEEKKTWYDVMYPTYKTRSKEFRELFDETSSKLIVDFSCAYSKDILRHGRLYISTQYCCFYSNIFGYENNIKIDWKDITKISKERTAFLIPNAIQINTESKQYFFATFHNRDATFTIMFRVWRGVLDKQPMSAEEVCQVIICQYPEEDGGDGSVSNEHDQEDSVDLAEEELSPDISDQIKTRTTSWREATPGEFVFDKTIRKPLLEVYNLLFTNSNFYFNFQKDRGSTELDVSDWEQTESGNSSREVSYNMKMNNPVGPKTCQVREMQLLQGDCITGEIYCIDTEAFNSGVPYADSFTVKTHICAYKDTAKSCRVTVKAEIVFRKELWNYLKGKIETSAWAGLRTYYSDLGNALRNYREDELGVAEPLHQRSHSVRHRLDPVVHEESTVLHNARSFHQQTASPGNLFMRIVIAVLCLTLVVNILVVWSLHQLHSTPEISAAISRDSEGSGTNSVPALPTELLEKLPQTELEWLQLMRAQAAQHNKVAQEIAGSLQKVCSDLIESEKSLARVVQLLEQGHTLEDFDSLLHILNQRNQQTDETNEL